MKKLAAAFGIIMMMILHVGMVSAQTQCTTINNSNYDACCSGVPSNDSVACNNFLNNNPGAATAAQCKNINSYVIYTNCCSGVPSNDSTYCNAYNNDNGGQPARTLTQGATLTTSTNPSAKSVTSGQNNALNIHLNNPLKVSTINDAISLFMSIIIRIALPLIIIFFIWAGLSFILARGNPKKLEDARRMFFYTVIGTLLILGAWVITNAIIGTVNSIMS